MAIDIFELNGTVTLDASSFESGINNIKSQLGQVKSSFGDLNVASAGFASFLGNVGADLLRSAGQGLMNIGEEALDNVRYNERLGISLENLVYESKIKAATDYEIVSAGQKVITVEQQIAAAMNQKINLTKDQVEANEAAIKAQGQLRTAELAVMDARADFNAFQPNKKHTPEQQAVDYELAANRIAVAEAKLAKIQATIAAGGIGAISQADMDARVAAITAGGDKIINITKKVKKELSPGDEIKFAEEARKESQQVIRDMERMAILSPFNKRQVTDTFFNLTSLAGFDIDKAKAWTQQLIDLATVKGISGENIEGIAYAIGKVQQLGKLQAREANSLVLNRVPIYELLSEKLGKTNEEIREMQKQGKITAEVVMPLIEEYTKKYTGAAEASAGTISGVIESLSDIKTFILTDFFEPIFGAFKDPLSKIVEAFNSGDLRQKFQEAGRQIGESLKQGLSDVSIAADTFKNFSNLSVVGGPMDALVMTAKSIQIDPRVSQGFRDLATAITPALEKARDVYNFIKDNWPKIAPYVQIATDAVKIFITTLLGLRVLGFLGSIVSVIMSPLGKLSLAIALFKAAWDTNFLGIQDRITDAWTVIRPILEAFLGGIQTMITRLTLGDGFGDAFDAGLKSIADSLGINADAMFQAFEPIRNVMKAIEDFVNGDISLGTALGSIIEEIGKVANNIATALTDPTTLALLNQAGATMIDEVLKGITTFATDITPGLHAFGANLGSAIGKVLGQVAGGLARFFVDAIGYLLGDEKASESSAAKFIEGFGKALAALDHAIAEAVRGFVENFKIEFVRQFQESAGNIGEAIGRLPDFFGALMKRVAQPEPVDVKQWAKDYWANIKPAIEEEGNAALQDINVTIPPPEINPEADPLYGMDKNKLKGFGLDQASIDALTPQVPVSVKPKVKVDPEYVPPSAGTGLPVQLQNLLDKSLTDAGITPATPVKTPVPISVTPAIGAGATADAELSNQIAASVAAAAKQPVAAQAIAGALSEMIGAGIDQTVSELGLTPPYTGSKPYQLIGKAAGDAIAEGLKSGLEGTQASLETLNYSLETTIITVSGPGGLSETLGQFGLFIMDTVQPAIGGFTAVIDPINKSLGTMIGIVETLTTKFDAWVRKVQSFKPPPILTPGSPTPFENGLRGILNATNEINDTPLSVQSPSMMYNNTAAGNAQAAGSQTTTTNSQPVTVTIPVYMDTDVIAQKTLRIIDGKVYEDSLRY